MKDKAYLFFAPLEAELHELCSRIQTLYPHRPSEEFDATLKQFWRYHSSRVGKGLYEEILGAEGGRFLSLSRLTLSCIHLTSRTKMSWPLAKRALDPRICLAIDSLQ